MCRIGEWLDGWIDGASRTNGQMNADEWMTACECLDEYIAAAAAAAVGVRHPLSLQVRLLLAAGHGIDDVFGSISVDRIDDSIDVDNNLVSRSSSR